MNCLKKGFFFGGGGGNKKENTFLHLSLAFCSSSTYRLSLSFPLTVLAYYQQTLPLTLNFYNIPCRSRDSNPRTIGHPRLLKSLSCFQAFTTTTILHMHKWYKVRLKKVNSQILYEVYLRRYAKYTRNKASFLVMITNQFLPQTQRSHSEKKMVEQANRTTKDNLCSLIKEKNSSPNHWCHHLGETACKNT